MRKSIQKPFERDALIELLKEELKRIGSVRLVDYDKNRKNELPASNIVRKRLGNISWSQVLELCGYQGAHKSWTKEKIIKMAMSKGRQLRYRDLRNMGIEYHNVITHFGSYKNLFETLGWEYTEKEFYGDVSKEELIEEYENVCRTIGKPATAKDIEENSKFSYEVFRSKFGSMNDLRKAAGYDNYRDPRLITKEQCLNEMLLIYDKYGKVSYGKLHEILPFHYRTLLRRFGTTSVKDVWNEVISEYNRRKCNYEQR